MQERCGYDKEVIIGLATISLSTNANGNSRPAVRMVCAYYKEGVFYKGFVLELNLEYQEKFLKNVAFPSLTQKQQEYIGALEKGTNEEK